MRGRATPFSLRVKVSRFSSFVRRKQASGRRSIAGRSGDRPRMRTSGAMGGRRLRSSTNAYAREVSSRR